MDGDFGELRLKTSEPVASARLASVLSKVTGEPISRLREAMLSGGELPFYEFRLWDNDCLEVVAKVERVLDACRQDHVEPVIEEGTQFGWEQIDLPLLETMLISAKEDFR